MHRAGPSRPAEPAGSGTECEDGKPRAPASARTGRARYFSSPLPASPQTRNSRASPNFEEGDRPLGCSISQQARSGRSSGTAGRRLPHAPRFCAAPRPATVPPRVTVRAGEDLPPPRRLPTWGTCGEMPGPGDFVASPASFPAREGVAAPPSPSPGPDATARRCRRRAAANGLRGGGTAGGCQPPGAGSAETGSARAAAPRAVGAEPRELEEEPPRRGQRTTARLGCGGPALAPLLTPRAPDRQHDRRAAPGLLLHGAEG